MALPKANVVVECKLDPINNLWDLRDHSESGYPNKILEMKIQMLALLQDMTKSRLSEHAQWHILT